MEQCRSGPVRHGPSTVLKCDLDIVSEDEACRLGVGEVGVERHGPRAARHGDGLAGAGSPAVLSAVPVDLQVVIATAAAHLQVVGDGHADALRAGLVQRDGDGVVLVVAVVARVARADHRPAVAGHGRPKSCNVHRVVGQKFFFILLVM